MEKTESSYSLNYQLLKSTIENTWSQWKIDWYNNKMATSAHAKKLQRRPRNPECYICPICGAISEYNAYYSRITCTRCSWESEKLEVSW